MEQKRFWSVAATQGGVIGLVLAASMFFETYASLSGSVGLMGLMLVEWIAVVVLHYWLLNRYTKQYAAQFSAEEGFPFFELSAAAHQGTRQLMQTVAAKLRELPPVTVYEPEYVKPLAEGLRESYELFQQHREGVMRRPYMEYIDVNLK